MHIPDVAAEAGARRPAGWNENKETESADEKRPAVAMTMGNNENLIAPPPLRSSLAPRVSATSLIFSLLPK